MNKYEDLYCKIFIDTDEERELVLNSIANTVAGNIKRWIISTNYIEIELRKNDDFNETLRFEEQDGFLYSRYYLELEPIDDTNQEQYISNIAMLLEKLWLLGYKAVTACDFENELPRKGGYKYEKE